MGNSVKIDNKLLTKVKKVIKSKRLKYPTVKHFVDIAVLNLLKKR